MHEIYNIIINHKSATVFNDLILSLQIYAFAIPFPYVTYDITKERLSISYMATAVP